MQAAINPALAAAMTLERAAQVGEFNPVTPDGAPTVAAQLMQRAVPPSVPQIAQQAGIGGQIQAMQMQEAQKALMNAAMQQQQPETMGIAPMAGPMRMAEGGIVGYAEAGMAEDENMIIEPFEGGAEMVVEPAAPSAPAAPAVRARPEAGIAGLATSSAPAIAEVRRVAEELAKMPVSADPNKAMEAGIVRRQVAREFARATGNDADLIDNQIRQMEDFYRRRDQQLASRAKEIEGRKERESLAQYMMNFQQMRGRPIGEGLASASRGLAAFQGGMDKQMREIEDLRIQAEGLKMERVNALRAQKYNTDMGFLGEAMKDQQRLVDNARALKKTEYDLAKKVAELHSAEARVAAREEGMMERSEEREETIRRGQDIRRELGLIRPGTSGREPLVRKVESDAEGNAIAVMSDGTSKPLGYKSSEHERRIGQMQQKLLKDGPPGYKKASYEEQRRIATDYMVGKQTSPAPAPTSSPAPSVTPSAAPRGTKENPIKLD